MKSALHSFTAWTVLFAVLAMTILPTVSTVYAQNYTTSVLKCPDYKFARTLSQGSRGEDVRLIQSILNLDYRTRVAPSGVGSKGYETDLFGVATREALKRFQALFIEFIGIADGKFNARTMTVMNAVCQGSYFTNGSGGVYDGVGTGTSTSTSTTTNDVIGPSITISAPSIGYTDDSFRLWIVANEPIQNFNLDSFITLGGATLSDLRKENPTTYKVLVTPTKTTSHSLSFQLEADAIQDLKGNKNPNSSNELIISLSPRPAGPDTIVPSALLSSGALGVMTINSSGVVDPIVMTLTFSEPINGSVNLSDFVIRGPITLSDLKRLDNTTFSFTVNSSATTRSTGSIQLPAALVADVAGNKNTASNEYQMSIIDSPNISSINLPSIASVAPGTNPTTAPTYTPPTYDYGSGGGAGSGSGGGQTDPMQMLMMLMMGSQALSGLTGLLGKNPFSSLTGTGATTPAGNSAVTTALSQGGKNFGGIIAPSGACVCPASPYKLTVVASNVSGTGAVPGIYALMNPSIPMGPYVGAAMPAPTICGSDIAIMTPKGPTCPRGGIPQAMCCNIMLNSNMQPVIGVLIKAN